MNGTRVLIRKGSGMVLFFLFCGEYAKEKNFFMNFQQILYEIIYFTPLPSKSQQGPWIANLILADLIRVSYSYRTCFHAKNWCIFSNLGRYIQGMYKNRVQKDWTFLWNSNSCSFFLGWMKSRVGKMENWNFLYCSHSYLLASTNFYII